MMSLLELFVSVDDFCQVFLPDWEAKQLEDGSKKRLRRGQLSISEMMTILIYFHQPQYRHFKAYYTEHVCQHLYREFPNLISYERFVAPAAFCVWTFECLYEQPVRSLSRHFVYRFDCRKRV